MNSIMHRCDELIDISSIILLCRIFLKLWEGNQIILRLNNNPFPFVIFHIGFNIALFDKPICTFFIVSYHENYENRDKRTIIIWRSKCIC